MISISLAKHHLFLPTFFHMIKYLSFSSYHVVQQKIFSFVVNKYTILGGVCPNDPFFSISTNVFYLLSLWQIETKISIKSNAGSHFRPKLFVFKLFMALSLLEKFQTRSIIMFG